MDIYRLSSVYEVRRLDEADAESVLAVCQGNPMFFEYCPPVATKASILEDMKALPKGKTEKDKYYLGFF